MSARSFPPGPGAMRRAVWDLRYQDRIITSRIAPYVESLEYCDVLHGRADELVLTLSDGSGEWRGPWYPDKGDRIALDFGLEGAGRQSAGRFEIEEIELEFTRRRGALLRIKALSAGVSRPLRTVTTQGHEKTSLARLAAHYGLKHGLAVMGSIPEIEFERITQHRETDLGFLKRIAEENGLCLAIKDEQLVFTALAGLKDSPPVLHLGRGDLLTARLIDRSLQTYRAASVCYSDPATGQTIAAQVEAGGMVSGDVHKITGRVETVLQARHRAAAALLRLNAGARGGFLRLPGTPAAAAGLKLSLDAGFGRMAGDYLIEAARHQVSLSGGYTTELEVKTL